MASDFPERVEVIRCPECEYMIVYLPGHGDRVVHPAPGECPSREREKTTFVPEGEVAATIRQAKAEALREAADVFEAMTDDYTSPLSSDEAASYAMLRDNAAGLRQHADRIAAGGDPIGAGTYGCPSVYGPPPTCVLPAGHDGLHMRDVSDPSGDRPVAVEPQPEPFDMAPAEIDEFLSALEDPDGGDHR